jgi:hypothetical protein
MLTLQRTAGNAAVNMLMRDAVGDIAGAVATMADVASFQLTLLRHLGKPRNHRTVDRGGPRKRRRPAAAELVPVHQAGPDQALRASMEDRWASMTARGSW